MLEPWDIELIKQTRKEMTRHRLEDILLYKRTVIGTDPFTGDPKYGETTETVQGTWRTLISQSGGEGEIQYVNGVLAVTDDAIINLDIEVNVDDVTKVQRGRTGEQYVVKAKDLLGLGEMNRHYILLELIK